VENNQQHTTNNQQLKMGNRQQKENG